MIHDPTLKKYHSSNLYPVGLQETVQTRNFKILISFLSQWCKSIFWKPTKKPLKIFSNHQHFLRKHLQKFIKITEIHSCSILFQKKLIYKNVNSWIQRNMLFCNTWINFDHKIISSFYHIIIPLFTKEICAPKNSCFVWRHLG